MVIYNYNFDIIQSRNFTNFNLLLQMNNFDLI